MLVLTILSGCSSVKKPIAQISFLGIHKVEQQYQIEFKSNIDLDLLYSETDGEKVVSRRLVCSLGDDVNLSVGLSLEEFFRGNVGVASIDLNSQGTAFRYQSVGNFYVSRDQGASKQVINDAELIRVLGLRATIPCRVSMTIYLEKPYYSSTMQIPTASIAAEANR